MYPLSTGQNVQKFITLLKTICKQLMHSLQSTYKTSHFTHWHKTASNCKKKKEKKRKIKLHCRNRIHTGKVISHFSMQYGCIHDQHPHSNAEPRELVSISTNSNLICTIIYFNHSKKKLH